MITVTAPISLTEYDQPLFTLAWKAKNLGAESYVASETHVGYLIKPEHDAMLDHSTIEGIVAVDGDIENLSLFLEIDPEGDNPFVVDEEGNAISWASYFEKPTVKPTIIDGKYYIGAKTANNHSDMPASEVIASGLTWFTTEEFKAMLPVETNI